MTELEALGYLVYVTGHWTDDRVIPDELRRMNDHPDPTRIVGLTVRRAVNALGGFDAALDQLQRARRQLRSNEA